MLRVLAARIEGAGEGARIAVSLEDVEPLESELAARARQQEAVARLGLHAIATSDLKTVLDEAVDVVARTLEVDFAAVLELEPDGSNLLLRAGVGWREGYIGRTRVPTGRESGAAHALLERTPVVAEDIIADPRFRVPAFLRVHGVVGSAAVPIPRHGGPYGVLGACTRERRVFSKDDVNFLRAIANVIGNAVERRDEDFALRERGDRLREVQKLEAVGRLSAGVAHHFNNLLTGVLGHAELIFTALPPDHRARRHALEITKAAERASLLIQQLLAFGRRQMRAPRVIELNPVIQRTERLLRPILGEGIDLHLDLGTIGRVRVDPGQVEQAVMHLAVNAKEAMPHGGRIGLATRNAELSEAEAGSIPGARPGPHVALTVADTGLGMDERTRERAFEPFFTTKDPAHPGLGLSTVYGIVRQSGGCVRLGSAPGRGTTVAVYLPRILEPVEVGEPPSPPPAAAEATGPRAGRLETVLIADPDGGARGLAASVLRLAGYRVIEARDAGEARAAVERRGGRIDLVLADAALVGVARGGAFPEPLVLSKPFTPEALAARVERALARGARARETRPPAPAVGAGAGEAEAGLAGAERRVPAGVPSRGRILVVEDDTDIRDSVRELLADEGYEVGVSANGAEALERLRLGPPPGLILLDLAMPVMDGSQFRAEQRHAPDLAPIPVIILTAAEDPEKRAKDLAVEGYLRKPIDPERLIATVARYHPGVRTR